MTHPTAQKLVEQMLFSTVRVLLSLVSAPQGDMGATGPAGAPGPKGEKGDTVSEGLSTMASVGDPSPWAWGCLPATLASPRTTPPQPLESCAPDGRCIP